MTCNGIMAASRVSRRCCCSSFSRAAFGAAAVADEVLAGAPLKEIDGMTGISRAFAAVGGVGAGDGIGRAFAEEAGEGGEDVSPPGLEPGTVAAAAGTEPAGGALAHPLMANMISNELYTAMREFIRAIHFKTTTID
jgi:hypothetical protein